MPLSKVQQEVKIQQKWRDVNFTYVKRIYFLKYLNGSHCKKDPDL